MTTRALNAEIILQTYRSFAARRSDGYRETRHLDNQLSPPPGRAPEKKLTEVGHAAVSVTNDEQAVINAERHHCDVAIFDGLPADSILQRLTRANPAIRLLLVGPTPPIFTFDKTVHLISEWAATLTEDRVLEAVAALRSRRS